MDNNAELVSALSPLVIPDLIRDLLLFYEILGRRHAKPNKFRMTGVYS
jgi:hypothetical protein